MNTLPSQRLAANIDHHITKKGYTVITPSPLLISSLDEARDGIRRFQEELATSGIVDLLSSFRAWYAISDEGGRVLLAPSKFIGYQGLTARTYPQATRNGDGRAPETVLRRWFWQPSNSSERILIQELARMLSPLGRKPNKLARVSTIDGLDIIPGQRSAQPIDHGSLVDAMLVIYKTLPADDQLEFKRRIKG